jgi:hypothetical protein
MIALDHKRSRKVLLCIVDHEKVENVSPADIVLFLDKLMISQFVSVWAKSPAIQPF